VVRAECLSTGELRLACRGDQSPIQPGRGYSTRELAQQLVASNCPAVYLILDVCHAEAGAPDIYKAFTEVWNVSAPRARGLALLCPRVWDLATRQSLVLEIDHRVYGLALSNSGLLVVGTQRGLITVQLSAAWLRPHS
jgi:hypothetical protein